MRLQNAIFCVGVVIGLLTLCLAPLEFGSAIDMPSPSWRTKTGMPTARGQAAVVAGDDGLVYAMGGFAGTDPPNATVEAYNPIVDLWTIKEPLPIAVRGAASAKGSDGTIYVIGGVNGTDYLANVQAYNATSRIWSQKTVIPTATWAAGAATGDDGKIYVVGGESPEDFYGNKTQIYDPSTDSWTSGMDLPTGRSMLGVVKGPNGLIYAIGGYNGSALSVVEAYNPINNTWTEKASMMSPRLEFGVALGPDEKIYVIGGGSSYFSNEEPFFDTVEVYDPKTDTWTTPTWSESALPTARRELGAALGLNGRIYAIGGANGAYIAANEEALIVQPENIPPIAFIDYVTPNPAIRGQTISFFGHGTDPDGSVTAYRWRSSINGTISNSTAFGTSKLSEGIHTIYFSVKDNSDSWSAEAVATVMVNKPATEEDPAYQELLRLNETLNGLRTKIDIMTMGLLGASVIIIALVIVNIARYKQTERLRRFGARVRRFLQRRKGFRKRVPSSVNS